MDESDQQAKGDVIRGAENKRRFPVIVTGGMVWLLPIVTGLAAIVSHANPPSGSAIKPATWPVDIGEGIGRSTAGGQWGNGQGATFAPEPPFRQPRPDL